MPKRRSINKTRFAIRAQVKGMIAWVCPYCGTVNKRRVKPGGFLLTCTGSSCGLQVVFGFRFQRLSPGTGSVGSPPDCSIRERPRDAMPEYCIDGVWYTGNPAHHYDDEPSD